MISWNLFLQYIYIICICLLILNFHQTTSDKSNINENSAQTSLSKSCPFSGTRYPLGESWFRRLDTHDMSYCVACVCAQGGKSNCTSKPCDGLIKLCEEATHLNSLEKGCCQQCTETDETKRVEIHVKSHINLMKTSTTTVRPVISGNPCQHNGRTYKDNQIFASNTSGIHRTSDDQCVQCICQAGLVLCRLKTCYSDSCSSVGDDNNGLNEDCCPLRANCRDKPISDSDNYYKREGHLVTIYSPNDDSSSGSYQTFNVNDCNSGGRVYTNGAKWHPIIGPFGQMDCVICICNTGTVECSRVDCHSHLNPNCLQTKPIQGQCCPVCVHLTNDNSNIAQTIQPFIESYNKSNQNNENIDNIEEKTKGTEGSNMGSNMGTALCVPLRMDTIVYRSHAQSSHSAYYQYAFQTKDTNRSTSLFSFTVKDGKIADFSQQHLTQEEYDVLSQTFKFKLLGATKSKFVEKWAKRAKKYPQRCNQNCKTKVERLERSLRLKEVSINILCDKLMYLFY